MSGAKLAFGTVRKVLVASALAVVATAACKKEEPAKPEAAPAPAAEAPKGLERSQLTAFAPLPEAFTSTTNPENEAKIALGKMLYHETRLSKDNDISCNSCHVLSAYGVDNKPTSPGHKGQLGGRNSPTVFNAAGHFVQFWDGRAKDVEEQALGPILNPVEMALDSSETAVAMLKALPEYVTLFQAAFPGEADPVSWNNVGKAIGAFERKLATPSRWDKYLAGDDKALTDEEKAGAQEFLAAGCTACHSGPLLGGSMYQKAGLIKPWPNQKDLGRFEVTKDEADKLKFKVPSLRNIAKTGPYFHDGSVAKLEDAVKMMADHQLGRQLTDTQVASIVTFLGALTGELPEALIKAPQLPPAAAPAAAPAAPAGAAPAAAPTGAAPAAAPGPAPAAK